MPISSSKKSISPIIRRSLSLLLFLLPLFVRAQSLTGLWTGTIHNDSVSVRKDQSFEIALTEKDGKVTGFSRNEFIVNDTLYTIVKKVKGTIKGNVCEVTDEEVISYNFPGKLEKGISVTSTFLLDPVKNSWYLSHWKTNAIRKKYYSVGGKMNMEPEKDLRVSKLIAHLEELNQANTLTIYREQTEAPVTVRLARPEKNQESVIPEIKKEETAIAVRKPELPSLNTVIPEKPVRTQDSILPAPVPDNMAMSSAASAEKTEKHKEPEKEKLVEKAEKTAENPEKLAKSEVNKSQNENPANPLIALNPKTEEEKAASRKDGNPSPEAEKGKTTQPVKTEVAAVAVNNRKTSDPSKTIAKTAEKPASVPSVKPENIAKTEFPSPAVSSVAKQEKQADEMAKTEKPAIPAVKPSIPQPAPDALVIKKTEGDPLKKSAVIAGRKSEFSQELVFSSDSLVLTLYDNGEIDGDTVSVYINGEVVLPSQGLKSSAIRKTIHPPAGAETFTLVMFAESLGKYPPNTGLLVIRDGNDVYNLRFSSDFQKSAGIVFRRKITN